MLVAARFRAASSTIKTDVTLCKYQFGRVLGKRASVSISQNMNVAKEITVLTAASTRTRDSGRLLDAMEKSNLQMSCTELNLLKKHTKQLELDQQKNIYDVIDSIELNTLVTEAHLEKMLHILNDRANDVRGLNDLEVAVLISATGCRCQMLSEKQREIYTVQLLRSLKMRGISLGLAARNALLKVQIDNNIGVDCVETLRQYEKDGLIPNAQTYGQLSRIYAQKNDVQGILQIIDHIRNIGLKVPGEAFESLVYTLARSNQEEKAMSLIEHVASDVTMANDLRMIYALAKAECIDGGNMFEVLDEVTDISTFSGRYQKLMYDILFALARNGNFRDISKLKTVFPLSSDIVDGNQWSSVVRSRIFRFLTGEDANIIAAAMLLDFIPNAVKRSKMHTVLKNYFLPTVRKQRNTVEAVKICIAFQKCNILKYPLRTYLRDVALNNCKYFYNLFLIYKETEDYMEVKDRPHLRLPDAVHHFNELSNAATIEEKLKHYLAIVHSLHPTGHEFCGESFSTTVIHLFIGPLLKDLDIFPELMRKLENEKSVQSFVVDVLITHLLVTRQMQLLQSLLKGPLRSALAGENYPCNEVKNIILNSSVYSRALFTACSLVRLLFSHDADYTNQYEQGIQIIKTAIVNSNLKKAEVVCKVWSKDKRISLRKADKDNLSQILAQSGEHQKKQLVALLLQKKTMQNSTVQESKRPMQEKPNKSDKTGKNYASQNESVAETNVAKGKRIGAELRQALNAGDLEKAKQIWIAGFEYAPVALGLLLIEKLYAAKMTDQFKNALLILKERHQDLSYHVLTAYDSSDASDERIVFLSEVCRLLELHSDVKQQLVYNTRVNAFHKAIEIVDLHRAYELSKLISAQKNSVFGQLDLMTAAIDKNDTTVLSDVLNLIKTYHGRESSLADFCVSLLECYKRDQARRLVQSSDFRLSAAKLSYYIDREIELKRMEVIFDLFELCIEAKNLKQEDLESAIFKIASYYGRRNNKTLINVMEERVKATGVRLSPKVDALLAKSKGQNFANHLR